MRSVLVSIGVSRFARTGQVGREGGRVVTASGSYNGSAGLGFGDIVQAHVFMAPDPKLNGGMDFMGMNKVWLTYFGTKEQPNKPARAAFKVAALAGPGALLEIEFIAAKKAK